LTDELVSLSLINDPEIIELFKYLKANRYFLTIASNSIRSTIISMLHKIGVLHLVDQILSNQDVTFPKPHPEIYMTAMLRAKSSPKETVIIEDSYIGRKAAQESGAFVIGVRNRSDVSIQTITRGIERIQMSKSQPHKSWEGGNMNVLIPMAGAGSRFEQAGYTFPKPLIDVLGKPMIQTVVENININARYIFIVQRAHAEKYNLVTMLNLIVPNSVVVQVEGLTEGAACTTLLAKEFINNDDPLLMANSDQFVKWDSSEFMFYMHSTKADGGILTFSSTHPKWSYAKVDDHGIVKEVAEKKPISSHATVGIYFWSKGSDYVNYAEQMISKNIRTNNEFYVCPAFNEAIEDGKVIRTFQVPEMWGLGTPEDLVTFQENFRK
jgi:dTDP-glucose pyrophosphorylase